MKEPTRKELLAELIRAKTENERLGRLVTTQRPELYELRNVECALREMLLNHEMQLRRTHEMAAKLLPPDHSDLPSLAEFSGCLSRGKARVDKAIAKGMSGDIGARPEHEAQP